MSTAPPINICSPENPMPKDAPGRWQHVSTEEIGDQQPGWPAGDIVTIRCKTCGHTWEAELPQ